MKRFLKVTPVLLLALVLALSPLLMAVPASAASEQLYVYGCAVLPELPALNDSYQYSFVSVYSNLFCSFSVTSDFSVLDSLIVTAVDDGSLVSYALIDGSWVLVDSSSFSAGDILADVSSHLLIWSSVDICTSADTLMHASDPVPYTPSSGGSDGEVITGNGIFYQAYDLFSQYIYGVDAADLSSDQTLTLTFLATLAALFLVSLPFILVIGFIKLFR